MLVGREAEQSELDSLLANAREERSAVLVLRGEPGIGKTALLEYAEAQAADMRVLRCVGIEAEHELPFAGMHQLVRPCLELIDRLPEPQGAALNSALGLSLGGVEDRFLVSLGLLSLLAEACEERPVLCCIDDAQWLDAPSAEALVFAARRFQAEPIAVLMAVREGELRKFEAPGMPELSLAGLDDENSRTLLSTRTEASPDVLATLLSNARGNPLALLELPAALTPAQLQGIEPIIGPPPVRPAVEDSFRARVAALPERTRRLLLLAAADEVGDLPAIRDAAAELGLDGSDLEEAERDGLVRVDGSVEFRHPLVRSAIYRSATREERKAAHEALAAAVADQARSAWHLALVTDGASEEVAVQLEEAGAQAVKRGAQATACAAFERAAELSENAGGRGRRLARAAQASLDAGRPDAALALAERAQAFVEDPIESIMLEMIKSTDAARRGSLLESSAMMRTHAAAFAETAPEEAAEMLIWSVMGALATARIEEAIAYAVDALDRMDTTGPIGGYARVLIKGMAAVLAGDIAAGARGLGEAFDVGTQFDGGRLQIMNSFVGALLGDWPSSRRVSDGAIAKERRHGSLPSLAGAFPLLVLGQVGEGRLAAATASIEEGLEISERLGFENDTTALLALKARIAGQLGREDECRELAEVAMRRSLATDLAWATEQVRLGLAELELGLGNSREALELYEQLDPTPLPPIKLLATPDIIDAALRLGEPERARAALADLEAWAPLSRAPLVAGLLARCRAVLADAFDEAERLFEDALRHHLADTPAFERARTELAYGERLRRERRKIEARTQLRNALDAFEGLGTKLWAERARGELKATGETARKRDASTLDDLTPQELRIAQLVGSGATNRDVAAQLFVSPKTVEYHLRKVFMKVGVNSRVELARLPLGEPALEHA